MEIKKDTKIVGIPEGTDNPVELTCEGDCPSANTTTHFYAYGDNGWRHGFYLTAEGKTWVRGWTGKVATAFKRTIAAEDRKRKLAEAKREREKHTKHVAHMTKSFQQAAAIVRRAKLPRELRPIAFMTALGPMSMMVGPWMLGR